MNGPDPQGQPRPQTTPRSRRFAGVTGALGGSIALIAAIGLMLAATSAAAASLSSRDAASAVTGTVVHADRASGPKPTVVLVHGAFADASGWDGVITRLQAKGYPVIAPANPLRSVAGDAAYLRSILANIEGPVILVGHSYGGVVITNAATDNANVKALVYVAAFGPDEGESVGGLTGQFPGSMLTPDNLIIRPYATSDTDTGLDGYINPAVFRTVFCADLPKGQAAAMAATQRPGALATLGEPSGAPAWTSIPSWYVVARQDNAIPPAAERFMAERMGAQTVEVDASHVVMISHPGLVADLIVRADRSTR